MLKDPCKLYAPGPLYHIVERKPFRYFQTAFVYGYASFQYDNIGKGANPIGKVGRLRLFLLLLLGFPELECKKPQETEFSLDRMLHEIISSYLYEMTCPFICKKISLDTIH